MTQSPPAPTSRSCAAPDATSPLGDVDGQDAVGTRVGRGRDAINWRRNLYAVFAAQLLAIVAFSLRAPFLPFFLGDLGLESTTEQALWSGLINAGGAGVMAITAPFWGRSPTVTVASQCCCGRDSPPLSRSG